MKKKLIIGLCAALFAFPAEAEIPAEAQLAQAQFEDARHGQKYTEGVMVRKQGKLYVVIPNCNARNIQRILLIDKLEVGAPIRVKTKDGTRECKIEAMALVHIE